MTDVAATRLVATYRSRQGAEDVAAALRRAGIPDADIVIGHRDDQTAAAVSEQREEMGETWKLGPSAIVTKEQAEGATTAMPFGAAIGAVLGLGLGFVLPDSMALWARLGLGVGIGALFGAVATMVIGAGLGARGPAAAGAAQGTPLSVAGADASIREILEGADHLRIDLVEGTRSTVVETEGGDEGRVEHLRSQLQQPTEGDWSTVAPEEPRVDETPDGTRGS